MNPGPCHHAGSARESQDRDGSRVHCDSLDEGGARLCPCGLATATPQHVTVASDRTTHESARSSPTAGHTSGGGCAPLPAHIHQVQGRFGFEGLCDAGSSRTPLRHACRTRTVWQYRHAPALSGLLPPSPAPPGSGCPQLHRPAATGTAAKVSHLPSNHNASRRTHDLRHTHLAWLIAGGAPLPHIQARLGHQSITTTIDTYGHLLPAGDELISKIIDTALTGGIIRPVSTP